MVEYVLAMQLRVGSDLFRILCVERGYERHQLDTFRFECRLVERYDPAGPQYPGVVYAMMFREQGARVVFFAFGSPSILSALSGSAMFKLIGHMVVGARPT